MEFHFQKEYLDLVLVPFGLIIMFGYHLFLLHRYLHRPKTTSLGFENQNRKNWVHKIKQMQNKSVTDLENELSVITANITSATFLATVSLTICSLIGTWIAKSKYNVFLSELIYGDTRTITMTIKYICLQTSFLLAFACFVQSTRHFVHASYLICTPDLDLPIPVESVEKAVLRGTEFWVLGLRSVYFAVNFLLWFFGPIPMFVSSILLVLILHWLDYYTKPLHLNNDQGLGNQKPRGQIQKGKSSMV
ncbi:hypothetical protein QN277_006041 [Acacia crassicarpa]|uniref:DUF599 domain-containing protein n=1 Tax=Acacia crassicarpa TaxID=499986 RepID=A0AAE1IXI1_9FABA|nr:hypothetical protein QN277_006041 [Acacia crassicarpa]